MSRTPTDDDNEAGEQQQDDGSFLEGEAIDPSGAGASDFDKLKSERDSLFERLARATAEFQNSRKRLQAEADQRSQYANSALIKSLLPVIDNFERALAQDPSKTDGASLIKGMQIVHDQWLNVLKQQQVEEISPQPGDPFNPTQHEALMQAPSAFPPGSVVQTLQKGYSLHDRTLRPAQVSVSKAT